MPKHLENSPQEIISTIRKSKARLKIDIVCDSYHKQSLKSQTRSVRGDGQKLAFDTNTPLPIDICNTFLRNNENKKNLNQFLTNEILMHISDRIICITLNQNVWTNVADISYFEDLKIGWSQEEADTKLIIHIWNSLNNGYQYIQITTSDTDVVVILLAYMPKFLKYSATITVIFGVGQNKKLYNMNEIAQRIGEDICLGIPFFYAFSGCDVTSSFYGISKSKWWEMWSKNEKLNKTFIDLSWTPICVTDAVFTEISQKSYLSNRWQRTKINSSFSTWAELIIGVPQGSVLGPLLFNIFINDLFFIFEDTVTCNYADDNTIYSSDLKLDILMKKLECSVQGSLDWFENNGMKLNSSKCHLLVCGHKYECMVCDVGHSELIEEHKVKLLGIWIDSDLSFDDHKQYLQKCSKKMKCVKGPSPNWFRNL